MMAATRNRYCHPIALACGALVAVGAALCAPKPSFAGDPVPPFSQHVQKEREDNIATETSTASYDETVKWLTENLLKNGNCRYTKLVNLPVGGPPTALKTTETITAASVKADVLELTIVSAYAGDSPSRTQLTETVTIPLRLVTRVSTADGDPTMPAAVAARGQFSYITLSIVCAHNEIQDKALTRSTSDDSPSSNSESTDILRTLNIHVDQNFGYVQRLEKAIRHLAKLARAMPNGNPAEPF